METPPRPGPRIVVLATLISLPAAAQSIEEKAQVCGACHGENGIPTDKSIPVIWGQHQGYLTFSSATTNAARARTSR